MLEVKIFLQKLSASRNGPEKSRETMKEWKHKKTILLKKVAVKKDWKTTLFVLSDIIFVTEVE